MRGTGRLNATSPTFPPLCSQHSVSCKTQKRSPRSLPPSPLSPLEISFIHVRLTSPPNSSRAGKAGGCSLGFEASEVSDSFSLEEEWDSLQSKAVWLGPGLQQGQARASQPGVQELPVTWRPALARKEVFWPVCLLWGSLAAPSSAKTSRCKENAWKTLVTQSTPRGCAWGNPSWGGGVGGTF